MSLSRADAFLYEHRDNEGPLLQSELKSGYFEAKEVWGIDLFRYMYNSGYAPFRKELEYCVENPDRWDSTEVWGGTFLKVLREINEQKLYEILLKFVQRHVSKEEFQNNRHAIIALSGFDIWTYVHRKPWGLMPNPSYDIDMLINEIREETNKKLDSEAISLDGRIIDNDVTLYTALDGHEPWEIYLKVTKEVSEEKSIWRTEEIDDDWLYEDILF